VGRKVLVTGGAGFVGSHLVDELLKQEYEVSVFDCVPLEKSKNLEAAAKHKNFKYFVGDIRNRDSLAKAWSKDLSIVYHLASVVGVHKYIDDPFGLIDITIGGTRNVAELALQHGTKILYTSTSEVFGKNPKIPWTEESDRVLGPPTIDRWSYSSSKALCEHMLFAVHRQKKLPLTVVRYFNAYGPRQSPIFVVSQSVYRVLKGQRPFLYDDGKQTRCFTYIDDAIRGTIMAATSEAGEGQAFNIGNNREVTIGEVVDLSIKHAGSNLTPEAFITQEKYGATYEDIPRRVPSNDKAKKMLGWSIQVEHSEGIRRTVEWAKQNPWWLE
jgi:dTDP-alpha-D-glucuronic acid decarboxylase